MKILIFLSCIIASINSYAEENFFNDEKNVRLEESIISSTGFEEKVGNTAQNVSIITKEEIRSKNYNDVKEILSDIPGVDVKGDIIDIRGQGKFAKNRILYMIDGVPINDTMESGNLAFDLISTDNIEQIEVITGGASVLYGDGAVGGVVNVITSKNSNKKAINKVSIGTGSYNEKNANFKSSFNIGNTGFDLSGTVVEKDAYVNRITNDKKNLSLSVIQKFDESSYLRFKTDYSKQDISSMLADSKENVDKDRKNRALAHGGERTLTNFSLEYDKKLSEVLRLNLTGYHFNIKDDFKNIDFAGFGEPLFKDPRYGLKTKLQYLYGKASKLTGGIDYIKEEAELDYRTPSGGMINNLSHDMNKESISIFAHNQANHKKWSFGQGIRYQHSDYNITNSHNGGIAPDMSVINPFNSKYKNNAGNIAAQIDASYNYSDTGNFYVRYEKGFVQPTPMQMIDMNFMTGEFSNNNLKPEKRDSYEIGFKDIIKGSFVRASIYYSRTKDEIVKTQIVDMEELPVAPYYKINEMRYVSSNINSSKRVGVELFAEQYLGDFTISESFNYVNAEVDSGEFKGKKITHVSPITGFIKLGYSPTQNLNITLKGNYQSSYYVDNANELPKIDSISLVDSSIKYKFNPKFTVVGTINNLFNKKYYKKVNVHGPDGYIPADERTFNLSMEYQI